MQGSRGTVSTGFSLKRNCKTGFKNVFIHLVSVTFQGVCGRTKKIKNSTEYHRVYDSVAKSKWRHTWNADTSARILDTVLD